MIVAVTDAHMKHTKDAIHALRYDVHAIGHPLSPAFYLENVRKKTVIPRVDIEKLVEAIKEDDVLMPIGFERRVECSKNVEKIPIKHLIGEFNKTVIYGYDKYLAAKEASAYLDVPKTRLPEEFPKKFPAIVKGRHGGRAFFVKNEEDLSKALSLIDEPIIQEFIRGRGLGYFALAKEGKIYAEYMHQRVVEYPLDGGPSVVAKTVRIESVAKSSREFLEALNRTGPVMIEYRYDGERARMIEINAKFRGSLGLGIAAGVNMPEIYVRLALGEEPEYVRGKEGVEFFRIVPDGIALLLSDPKRFFKYLKKALRGETKTNLYSLKTLPLEIILGIRRRLKMPPRKRV